MRTTIETFCPDCEGLVIAESTEESPIIPGALTVCTHCAIALVFTDALTLRFLQLDEWVALDEKTTNALGQLTIMVKLHNCFNRRGHE